MIYLVFNPLNNALNYFVPDAATQAQGIALGIPNSNWTIGGLPDADNLLSEVQAGYLAQQSSRFTCVKSTANPDGSETWISCDLSKEAPNTTTSYELFIDVVPGFKSAIGTDAANAALKENQQALLDYCNLAKPIELSELPPAPKV